MREKFAKLIDVKTIVTFALVGAAIVLAFNGAVDPMEIVRLAITAVTFYFGVKASENKLLK